MLSIGGRHCRLIHSDAGSDGRPTHSFKFLDPTDRDYWIALRETAVEIEVIECGNKMPDCDPAFRKPDLQNPTQLIEAPRLLRKTITLFDAYIFVDWSASSTPTRSGKEDSIWIAFGAYDTEGLLIVGSPINPLTRYEAQAQILEMLLNHIRSNHRVLIGFDFPYGYPAGWYTALGLTNNGSWQDLWNLLVQLISDNEENQNNRCEIADSLNAAVNEFTGPYWSRPNNIGPETYQALPAKKPACFMNQVREFREIELQLRRSGKTPNSVWQLFGIGAVGSQAMLGIPVLHRLYNEFQLKSCSQVWPFDTGWLCPHENRPFVLHAEIWPGAITVTRGLHAVKDAAQMLSYVYWAARLDIFGRLSARFNSTAGLELPIAVHECEGWILGD